VAANRPWRESEATNEGATHSIDIPKAAVAGDLIKRPRPRLDQGPRTFKSKALYCLRWRDADGRRKGPRELPDAQCGTLSQAFDIERLAYM
jgi:hypothetical protein